MTQIRANEAGCAARGAFHWAGGADHRRGPGVGREPAGLLAGKRVQVAVADINANGARQTYGLIRGTSGEVAAFPRAARTNKASRR